MSEFKIKIEHMEPSQLDIRYLKEFLDVAAKLISPEKKDFTEVISLSIENNCTSLIFDTPNAQLISNLEARLASVNDTGNLNIVPKRFRAAIKALQVLSSKLDQPVYLSTSCSGADREFKLSDKNLFSSNQLVWFTTELYLYGEVKNAGGQTPNLHIETDLHGTVIVTTPQSVLRELKQNILYKNMGIYVEVEQNVEGKIKDQRAKFVDFIKQESTDEFLNALESGVYSSDWDTIDDPVKWVRELRDAG